MRSIIFNQSKVYPSKVVCVGRNYLNHIKELNNQVPEDPVLFIKPSSAISSQLVVPEDKVLHYEAELCFLIQDKKIIAAGVGLDLTDRCLQIQLKEKGLPWEKAKAFDASAVFSEFSPLKSESDLLNLSFSLSINGKLRQKGAYEDMIYKPQALLNHIARYFTLVDDDIVMTGTPEGVAELSHGDAFEVTLYLNAKKLLQHQFIACKS